jgi:SAM-dependent methyltransferase
MPARLPRSLGGWVERAGEFRPERHLRFRRARLTLERFASGPVRVLDAGCGEGVLSLELARRHPDWTVVAVDTNGDMLRRGRERAKRERLGNVSFQLTDVTGPLDASAFDAVLAIQLLEEIVADETAIRSLARALRPDGLFVADVPERNWRPVLRGSPVAWRHEVRHGYDPQQLSEQLARSGLRVRRIEPSMRGTIRLAQELRDGLRKRSIRVRALAYPGLALAVPLERLGLTWGPPHSLFVEATRCN